MSATIDDNRWLDRLGTEAGKAGPQRGPDQGDSPLASMSDQINSAMSHMLSMRADVGILADRLCGPKENRSSASAVEPQSSGFLGEVLAISAQIHRLAAEVEEDVKHINQQLG